MVGDRSGLLTLAAYITVTMLIVLVAFWGVFHYGATARVSSLGPVPSEPPPELAVTGLQLTPDSPTSKVSVNGMDRQRIRLLESMLADKTKLVRQQVQQIADQTADLEELRQRYDDAMLMAVASLQGELVDERMDPTEEAPTEDTSTAAAPSADPDRLEAELMLVRAVHDALVSDLEALQDELDKSYEQLGQLREEADIASTSLRDAMVLEAASAGVLLRVGQGAVPALTEALAHTNPVIRRWAATVLGGMGPDAGDAAGALAEALSDSDPGVRRAAKAALDAIER